MKNMNKVRYNVSKVLEFNKSVELLYFAITYRDLFKPYGEDEAKSIERLYSKTEADLAREFGIKSWYGVNNLVYVNFKTKEDFSKVEHLFKKEHLRRGTNKYVFKGGAE